MNSGTAAASEIHNGSGRRKRPAVNKESRYILRGIPGNFDNTLQHAARDERGDAGIIAVVGKTERLRREADKETAGIRYAGGTAAMLTHIFDFSSLCGGKVFALSLGRVMMKLSHGILSGSVISTVPFYQSFLTWDSFLLLHVHFTTRVRKAKRILNKGRYKISFLSIRCSLNRFQVLSGHIPAHVKKTFYQLFIERLFQTKFILLSQKDML